MIRAAFTFALAAAVLSGCGGGSRAPVTLAATCLRLSAETNAVLQHRLRVIQKGGFAEGSPAAHRLTREVKKAAVELLPDERAAAAELSRMRRAPGARTAIVRVEADERKLHTLSRGGGREELLMNVFELGEAAGGCRHVRPPIGG